MSTASQTGAQAAPSAASRQQRRVAALLGILIMATVLAQALPIALPPLAWVETSLRDIRVSLLARASEPRTDMAILAITEDTLDQMPYRSPVDRGFLAGLLDYLAQAGARGVMLDVLFTQSTEPSKDAALAQAMRKFPAPLVVAWGDPGPEITARQYEFLRQYDAGVTHGYANLIRDNIGGAVRRLNVWQTGARDPDPTMAAAMAKALGRPLPAQNIALDYIVGPDAETPAIPTFPAHLAAPGANGAPPVLPPAFFAGKVVLIGADLLGADRFATPFTTGLGVRAGNMAGVTIHAQSLAQLLDGRQLKETGPIAGWAIIVAAAALGIALAALDLTLWGRLAAAALGIAGIWAAVLLAYSQTAYQLPTVPPSLGFVLGLGAASFYFQRRFLLERRFVRGALAHYVPEGVVALLEKEPWRLKLGGERRDLTFLFTDIAGFTALSERAEPTRLVAALNQYLDGATKIVLEHEGSVDKYIGDAVVAVFGAFDDTGRHAEKAVACALAIDAFAAAFAAEQRAGGLDFGITRIGVNSGSAIIGNFGGEKRFDYTAIGDAVNIASRLEGANKYLGTRICVAASSAEHAGSIVCRPAARLYVKGRDRGIDVCEPLRANDPTLGWLADYRAAYDMLARQDMRAGLAFSYLAQQHPDDPLVRFHHQRLQAMEIGIDVVLEGK
ncbi:MAG TPA: adenylate/guanylate cyclase domain-containing protein [Candidatus Cybelea sp.]|nr:adenylate/guanylate cyclase domain-containing protein [Candidatus Cybelea sp.]